METGLIGAPEELAEALKLSPIDADQFSPLSLAWMGDAVYELLIRTKLLNHGSKQVNKLQKRSSSLVRAGAQAALLHQIEEELTEQERAIYRRGRNAKSATIARHATVGEYRTATGFEALVGWLYLTNQTPRLLALIRDGLEKMGELE
ncbi:MAG: ribonuclease III [Clostridiales bacterium]|nr:ribonuclease III [Clostridiales bacterium]